MKSIYLLLACFTIGYNIQSQDASTLLYKIDGKEIAYPRLSANGDKILYQSNQHGPWSIHIMDVTTNQHTKVLVDAHNNNFPDWSADGQLIAFTSDRDGNEDIYLIKADGTDLKRITNHHGRDIHPYFSPDGKYLLFNSTRTNGSFDIFRYELSSGDLLPLSNTHEHETCARYSTDMKHIVYLRNGATADEIVIANSENKNPTPVTNTPNIYHGWPLFSYDGQWVYYSSQECGAYCVYRSRLDGSEKTQITSPDANVEDARVSLSRDGKQMIFNRRIGKTIEIRRITV
jgi:TolB protein